MRITLLSIFVLIGLALQSYGQDRDSVRVKRVYHYQKHRGHGISQNRWDHGR